MLEATHLFYVVFLTETAVITESVIKSDKSCLVTGQRKIDYNDFLISAFPKSFTVVLQRQKRLLRWEQEQNALASQK